MRRVTALFLFLTLSLERHVDGEGSSQLGRRKVQIRGQQKPTGSVASERIVNGQDATKGAYPFFAQRLTGGCGGTLIATKWVLSAAHCVPKLTKPPWRVGIYCNRPNENGVNCGVKFQDRQSILTRVHPRYNREIGIWDFVLFQLDEDVLDLPTVPIDDGSTFDQLRRGDLLRIVGMGDIDDAENKPLILQQVDNFFLPFENCFNRFQNGKLFNNSIVCSDGEDFGTCDGDSGSPVLFRKSGGGGFVLVGVNAFRTGTDCENHNNPDVAGRASAALPWIKSVVCPTYEGPNAKLRPDFCTPPGEQTSPKIACAQEKSVRFQFFGRRNQFNKTPRCKKIKNERQKTKFCDETASNAMEICKRCLPQCRDLLRDADSL